MTTKRTLVAATTAAAVLAGAVSGAAVAEGGRDEPRERYGTSALVGRAVLPAETYRPGSAPSGALFGAAHLPNTAFVPTRP